MRFLTNILAKAGLIVDGTTQLNTIANATVDTDKFLVSDAGVIKYRTAPQLVADLGPLPSSVLRHQVKLGEAINKGQAVYVSSADGTNMIVSKASNVSDLTSSKTLGLIETSGVLNDQVNVVTEGLLAGLDTSTATAGDPVWLGTNGNLIFGLVNKPSAPAHLVFIGVVTRVQSVNGEIFVKVQNGFELEELHNVAISSIANKNLLMYEAATSLWKNKTLGNVIGGTSTQYVKGDGTLGSFPDIGGGGGLVYYLNGSVSSGVAGYSQMSKTPVIGAGTDFSKTGDGLICQFLTDVNDPSLLSVPSGAWRFGLYASMGSPANASKFYVEVFKYDGTTFTLIGSSSGTPESVDHGTAVEYYTTTVAMATTALTVTDRIAVKVYATDNATRTMTIHTENSHLCDISTTFPSGIASINGLITPSQYLSTTTTGTDFTISSSSNTHYFNLPVASATVTGKLSSTDWSTFNNKQNALGYTPVNQTRSLTINGVTYDLSSDRTWSVGTVTSVGLSVPTGFSVSNTPVTGSGTIGLSFTAGYSLPTTASQSNWDVAYTNRITSLTTTGTSGAATLVSNVLNIPQYQAQGSYITSLTGEATASGPGAASVTLSTSAVTGKVLTGLNVTGGTVLATDSILTAFGKLQNQVNGLAGGVTYQGAWNASTNSPSLTSSVGTKGYYYVVSVAGSTNLNGITDWKLGDWAIFNGTSWEKVDNTDAVVSVNGFTGAVSLTTTNIAEGTNLYYTDTRARAAISLTTTGTSGAATYSAGVLNIPQYSLAGLGGVPSNRTLTINGTSYDLSADRTWTITNISGNSATTSQTNFSSLTVNSNTVLHAGNYNSYAPTLTGGGASGTWGISITGNSATTSAVSGTTNYIPKFTSSTAIGNSQIFDNGTNVGIGTGSPSASYKLTILGSTYQVGTNTKLYLDNGGVGGASIIAGVIGSSYGYLNTDGNFPIVFQINSSEQMRLTSTGLGIGTSPTQKLHVFGTSGATTAIIEGATNASAYGKLELRGRPAGAGQSTGWIVAASTEGGQAATNVAGIDFTMAGAAGNAHNIQISTHNGTSLTEKMRIGSTGTVRLLSYTTNGFVKFSNSDGTLAVDTNSYATTTGGGATGTWGINITGNADTVDGYHASTSTIGNYIVVRDGNGYIFGNYINMTDDGNPGGGTAITSFITKQGDNYYRSVSPTNAMSSIRGVASGTWGISITGNSATATTLQNARTINGTSFNGSANITTASWGTARTITIGSTGKSVDGSANVAWSLTEIGAPSTTGTGASGTWGINVTGNAGTVGTISADRIVYGGAGSRQGVTQISDWNQTTFPNAAFLSSESSTANAPTTDFTYGVQTSFHRGAPEYRTQFVTSLYGNNVYWLRQFRDSAGWSSWVQVLHTGNYNSYAPTLTGGGASGTWGISISGTSANTNSISSATGGSYTWTSTNYFQGNLGGYCGSLSNPPLQAYSTFNNSAFMSFHKSSQYAVNMGLDADNVLRIGGWSAAANRWELDMSGNCWVASSFRAPIFYDSNDTTYYLDPNAGSSTPSLKVAGNIDLIARSAAWSEGIRIRVPSTNTWGGIRFTRDRANNDGNWAIGFTGIDATDDLTFWGNNAGAESMKARLDKSANFTVFGSTRSPIFYDSDNTAYYLDPNGTSYLYNVGSFYLKNNYAVSTDHQYGIYFASDMDTAYAIYRESGAWTSPFPDLRISFHTGIKIGANAGYNGVRFYNDYTMATQVMSVNNGSDGLGANNVYVNNSLVAGSSLRAPIFYDSDDTGYYLDLNGTSNLNTLTTNTRARWGQSRYWMNRSSITGDQNYWTGTQGWGMDYGGWGSAWKGGFSGWDIWGTSTDHPQGSGYVHAQGIVSGQHYASSDGGSGHGWMIVGAGDATPNRYWLRGKWGGTTSSWTEMMTSNNNPYAWNMNQYVRTSDSVSFSSVAVNGGAAGYTLGVNGNIYCFNSVGGTALYASGEIYATGNIIAYSDARVKTNIREIENPLERVLKSRGVVYDRNDVDSNNNIGFIAQELEEQFPELVSTDEEGRKGVMYQNMVAVLLEAVKEQQKEIDELKAKLS